jgi:serine protease Do
MINLHSCIFRCRTLFDTTQKNVQKSFRRAKSSLSLSACRFMTAAIVLFCFSAGLIAEEPVPKSTSADSLSAKLEATPSAIGSHALINIAEVKALEKRIQKVVKAVSPSVVAIGGGGSGVVVSSDGYVLCVAHVGRRTGRNITFTFPDGRKVKGVTLGNCRDLDAGLMKITDPGPWPFVDLGRTGSLKIGQWCLALSYPATYERGKAPVVRMGRVFRIAPAIVETDCKIMGGDSGGPLFDLDGNVIGISSTCDDSLLHNRHVPIDCFHKYWDRLAKGEDFNSRNVLALLDLNPDVQSNEPRLGRIVPDSAADRAGLKAGDMILKFDGKPVRVFADLEPLALRHQPGCTCNIEIEVRREEQVLNLHISFPKTDP